MQETSIYCRPRWSLVLWYVYRTPRGLRIVGDWRGEPKVSALLRYLDSDSATVVDEKGIVWHIPLGAVELQCKRTRDKTSETESMLALLRVPRYTRKPDNYIHPDDCPELRRLLSKRGGHKL